MRTAGPSRSRSCTSTSTARCSTRPICTRSRGGGRARRRGRPAPWPRSTGSSGGEELLEELLGHDDASIREVHRREFERLQPLVEPLPGAVDLLRAVADGGGRAVIVTSTPG